MIRALLVVLAVAACHNQRIVTPGTAEDLAAYLAMIARADEATRTHEIASWIVDEAMWRRAIVEPYRALWPEYVRGFDAEVNGLVARLGHPGEITARRHYAGDPRLTLAQSRLRWAEPVLSSSFVAELGGTPIDTVFVFDGGHWRVLAGLDELMLVHVRARAPACVELLARAGASGRCTEVGWVIADAALRADDVRLAHACQLAATLCGNRSP